MFDKRVTVGHAGDVIGDAAGARPVIETGKAFAPLFRQIGDDAQGLRVVVEAAEALQSAIERALAGVAGVVLAARITTGQPNAGVGYELDAIAAVVIGGTSLSGGVGSIGGTILGALLIGVINNGLDLLNVTSYYQSIVKGVIIGGAVWLDQKQNKS